MASESQFHVLAVDDSIIDRKLIERLLRTSSYQVTTVDSGSKALEFLGLLEDELDSISGSGTTHQVVEVSLIITDYCMPGMTGYELLKRIKESSSLRNIPVVIMSSEDVPSRINRCLEDGAEEFLLKPVRMSDVNKLKPHIMRTKLTDEKMDEQEEESLDETEIQQSRKQQLLRIHKRKSMKEDLSSPNRTRPRFSDVVLLLLLLVKFYLLVGLIIEI